MSVYLRIALWAGVLQVVVCALLPHYVHAYGEAGYYSQSSYYSQSTYVVTFTDSVSVTGNVTATGALSKGSGTFVIDHPLDPENKLLYHSFVESPDVKNIYDGIATLDENGEVTIELPSYFEALNGEYRYQLQSVGAPGPNLYIKEGVADNRFTIGGGTPGGTVSWQVTGIRHDPYIRANPIVNEPRKGAPYAVADGEYLYEGYAKPGRIEALVDGALSSFRRFVSGI